MLRITRTSATPSAVTLKLEGRITGEWVVLLREECAAALDEGKELVLDCAGVTFLGADGGEMLRQMPPDKVHLAHSSPLFDGLL